MKTLQKGMINRRWMMIAILFTIHCSLFISSAAAQKFALVDMEYIL